MKAKKNKIMRKYKLKQWYPSLDVTLNVGDVIEITGRIESFYGGIIYEFTHTTGDYTDVGFIQECEFNNPDFWELIEEEKPLFVTEDGVDIFDLCQTVYLIHPKTFIKQKSYLGYFSTNVLDNNKVFFHESNADEYVWKNKRVFSYEDMMKAKHSIILTSEDIEKSAKERSKL